MGIESNHFLHQLTQWVTRVGRQLKQACFEHTQGRQGLFAGKHLRGQFILSLLATNRARAEGKLWFRSVFRPDQIINNEFRLRVQLLTLRVRAVELVKSIDLIFEQHTFRRADPRKVMNSLADLFGAWRGRHHLQNKSSNRIIGTHHHPIASPGEFQNDIRILAVRVQHQASWRGKSLQPSRHRAWIIRRQKAIQR